MSIWPEKWRICQKNIHVLRYNDADVNMGSLLNIVAMGIVHGDTVTVRCSGQREQQALDAYVALLK